MATLALIPVVAAAWLLSRPLILTIALVGMVLLAISVFADAGGRPTLVIVGFVAALAAVISRLYASALANLLPSSAYQSMGWSAAQSPAGAEPPTNVIRSLTRRELEVARLAAEGQTAAEIAGRLHIGERTVESHLASTYSKLGINSRTKLMCMAEMLPEQTARPGTR